MNSKDVLEEINIASTIQVIQGENPDGDSLASSLALEEILETAGKKVSMYCAVDIPKHLRYLEGWDRVSNHLANNFDLSIVVDTASEALLERTFSTNNLPILRSRPMIVIDHHDIESTMPFQTINYIDHSAASAGDVIYRLFEASEYQISLQAKKLITTSILFDTRGLTTEVVNADIIRRIADMVEGGVSLAELDEKRMSMNKRDADISRYKGELLQRVEIFDQIGLATVEITWDEIEQYSDRYNPSVLVLDEMRLINGVDIAIAYKTYPDGKILAKIRSNRAADYASILAEHFGGGGHPHAAGFKLRGVNFEDLKKQVIDEVKVLHDSRN